MPLCCCPLCHEAAQSKPEVSAPQLSFYSNCPWHIDILSGLMSKQKKKQERLHKLVNWLISLLSICMSGEDIGVMLKMSFTVI